MTGRCRSAVELSLSHIPMSVLSVCENKYQPRCHGKNSVSGSVGLWVCLPICISSVFVSLSVRIDVLVSLYKPGIVTCHNASQVCAF